jgi:hypothetical protein
MKPTVYLETTVVSYLAAWTSRDLVTAANQETTREWWNRRRHDFDLFVSQAVIEEASEGDLDAVRRRTEILQAIPRLATTDEVLSLAKTVVSELSLPSRAKTDALHIAASAIHGMNYLLTWNCTHIANAAFRPRIERICRSAGFEPPIICTPQELIGETDGDA